MVATRPAGGVESLGNGGVSAGGECWLLVAALPTSGSDSRRTVHRARTWFRRAGLKQLTTEDTEDTEDYLRR